MATCTTCSSEIAPGIRWCTICHTNIVDPAIGRLSSPGRRFGAYVLDIVVPFVAFLMMGIIAGLGGATGTDAGGGGGAFLGLALFLAYVVWALVLFARGTTPGKHLLGMRVVKEDGRHAGFLTMLFREWIGKWISGVVFGLGFLWILFDRDNQGWHDKIASTYVVEPATAARAAPVAV